MLELGKVAKKSVDKLGERLGSCGLVVKKFIQKFIMDVMCVDFGGVVWKSSEKIYTQNLFDSICRLRSFPVFAHISTTATYLNNEYTNKGGLWK